MKRVYSDCTRHLSCLLGIRCDRVGVPRRFHGKDSDVPRLVHSRWAVPGGISGLKLSSPTSGDLPLDPFPPDPFLPDPLDPSSTLSLNQFPFLSPNLPKQTRSRSNSKSNPNPNSSVTAVVGSAENSSLP
ncbi:hypothetical protein DY000_02023338 [Brassica cretica]|uniref:Uncharacterized protein n=1 Tax=Brassica cretica TaxID=69181 RepID=A0ABQ7EB54_BRACR|nr:hypothetical protein DY000_02023338 [Brassica cretica]